MFLRLHRDIVLRFFFFFFFFFLLMNFNRNWTELAEQRGIDLVVCISAAQRRGLLCEDEARRQGKQDNDLAGGFRIGGLGLWVEATLQADRCIVFG